MLAKSLIVLATLPLVCACSDNERQPNASQGGSNSAAGSAVGGGGRTAGSGGGGASNALAGAGSGGGTSSGAAGANAAGANAAGTNAAGSATAGAGGEGLPTDADVVPESLSVVPHAAACGILKLSGLTLRRGLAGLEMYVALENEGDEWACGPAFSVNVYDASEQHVGAAVGGLLVRSLYRLKDDPETTAACAGPGDVVMGAVTDFPPELELADVSRVEYWCSMWRFDVVPAGDLPITDLEPVTRDGGTAFAGSLLNGLDVPLKIPSVSVFPLSATGRPLGMAVASGTSEVAPGASWQFETDAVDDGGDSAAAYPTPTF